ncbi:MAG: sigma-70 family RNA polymerase sigma factor [Flavitalea sp.]
MPNNHSPVTDQQLLENFRRDRDNSWLGTLFQRYTLLLYGVCMKYLKNEEEAKDAVQQVFLKAITELKKYEVRYLKSWLYMIAKNYCLMKIRERQVKGAANIDDHQIADEADANTIVQHIEKNQRFELMQACLLELSGEQKQCVTLFYLEKKSYQDIAKLTGYSVMQIKSYIQNGKRNLKLLMNKKIKSTNT